MVSRILRVTSLLAIALATVLSIWLLSIGVSPWIAIAVGIALPPAMHAVPLGIEFITGAVVDRRPVARLGPVDSLRMWLTESWRSFVVFNVDQPWRAHFPEREIVANAGRPAVLLVHGYMCNRGAWRHWLRSGLPEHWNIATVNLEPAHASVDDYAACIEREVARLRTVSGAEQVTLVCHSMGGLAARAYLRAHGHADVARVITISTPHHGTIFARFARGANTRQMRRACEYVTLLAKTQEAVEFVCFASQHDNLIVPRESQVLAGAEAVWFQQIGHLAMTASEEVLRKLIEVVERKNAQPRDRQAAAARSEVDATH
ncbi:MAG: alpha/beta fold hydrolase [Burkholderiaceae bacterium]|nr:alpha/beta fold hydrolase [Burkholderiaceae bacterium]